MTTGSRTSSSRSPEQQPGAKPPKPPTTYSSRIENAQPNRFGNPRPLHRRTADGEIATKQQQFTIHVDRELHTDIKELAAKIERPAEIMLRRALRRLVTDVMNGRATKYIN